MFQRLVIALVAVCAFFTTKQASAQTPCANAALNYHSTGSLNAEYGYYHNSVTSTTAYNAWQFSIYGYSFAYAAYIFSAAGDDATARNYATLAYQYASTAATLSLEAYIQTGAAHCIVAYNYLHEAAIFSYYESIGN